MSLKVVGFGEIDILESRLVVTYCTNNDNLPSHICDGGIENLVKIFPPQSEALNVVCY